jgi:uncharacterized protein (DUF1684 family)
MTAQHQPFAYDRARHEAAVSEWRRARLSRLTTPDGWLSLVGRFPLGQGKSSVGAADGCDVALPPERAPGSVGSFELEGTRVRFTPAVGVQLLLRGGAGAGPDTKPLVPGEAVTLRPDRDGSPDKLLLGALTLEVSERESGFFVRVRDPDSPTRRGFAGIKHYPVDPKWRVVARYERYEPPRMLDLDYEAGSTQRYTSPGAAVFEIDGVSCRLDPVLDENRPRLYLVFWDPTARDTTYGAGRFLYAPLPEGDRVLLDFNQAFSPPCAFTPYAACPVAPQQNRLAVRVEAGEKSSH